MHTLKSKIGITAFLLGFFYNLHAHVILDYPQGGETFIVGTQVTIQWHVYIPHNTINWDLYFSSDGGNNWQVIQLDIPVGQLTYQWDVPNNLTSQGKVKVIQDNIQEDYQDISGNFNIEVITLPPFIDLPALDTTIHCNLGNQQTYIQSWLNNHGGADATNYCGTLIWTNNFSSLSNGCGGTGTAIVNFTATDECGSTMTNAVITVIDSDVPLIEVPALDKVVESNGTGNTIQLNNWINTRGGAIASDFCGNINWMNNFTNLSNGCGATGFATVTFTVRDECFNSATTHATFTIIDSVVPSITATARDTTVQCGTSNQVVLQNWLSNHAGAHATDINGTVAWANNYSGLSNGCGATGTATVIFTATDECGNSATTSATFTIQDHVAPRINAPSRDSIIECGVTDPQLILQSWLANHGGANASDICGNINWANNYSALSDSCGITGNAAVIFIVSDECGNSSTTSATFTIQDHTAPEINFSARDTSLVCGVPKSNLILQNWIANHGGAQASDLCGSINWTNNFTALSDDCSFTGNTHVIFTAIDVCGNTASTNATFSIIDTLDPEINVPAHDTTIQCGVANQEIIIQQWLERHGGASANDNCGNVNWTNDFPNLPDTCNQGISLTVTFTAQDECGNASATNANFTLFGTTALADPKYPDFDFKIYPNPADDILTVDFANNVSIHITLSFFDAFGQLLWTDQNKAGSIVIPVNGLPSGVYFLQINTEHGVYSRKVIIE